jgi:protocatechuate 3,4-dioxygenase alpha subunit
VTDPTASQTVGPFFSFALLDLIRPELVPPGTPGAVRIEGVVLDGEGAPVDDAMVEIWQADATGRYVQVAGPAPEGTFTGFGRCGTDADGRFWFLTIKPGPVAAPDGRQQAPHLAVSVFARGLLKRLVTRIYFPDEEAANAACPVLSSLPSEGDRATLVAVPSGGVLRFDIRLQGDRETVFFAL